MKSVALGFSISNLTYNIGPDWGQAAGSPTGCRWRSDCQHPFGLIAILRCWHSDPQLTDERPLTPPGSEIPTGWRSEHRPSMATVQRQAPLLGTIISFSDSLFLAETPPWKGCRKTILGTRSRLQCVVGHWKVALGAHVESPLTTVYGMAHDARTCRMRCREQAWPSAPYHSRRMPPTSLRLPARWSHRKTAVGPPTWFLQHRSAGLPSSIIMIPLDSKDLMNTAKSTKLVSNLSALQY